MIVVGAREPAPRAGAPRRPSRGSAAIEADPEWHWIRQRVYDRGGGGLERERARVNRDVGPRRTREGRPRAGAHAASQQGGGVRTLVRS